jgi:hypothetical protein
VLLEPLFDALPAWLLVLTMVGVGISVASAALGLVLRFLFGKDIGRLVLVQLIARAIEGLAKGVWASARGLSCLIWRGVASLFGR